MKLKCTSKRIQGWRPGPECQRRPSLPSVKAASGAASGAAPSTVATLTRGASAPQVLNPFPPRPRQRPLGETGHRASQPSLPPLPSTGDAGPTPSRRPEPPSSPSARPQPPPAGTRERGPYLSSQSLHLTCSGTSCWNRTWLMLDRCPAAVHNAQQAGSAALAQAASQPSSV